jgi:glucose/arabinose dehydrogenase
MTISFRHTSAVGFLALFVIVALGISVIGQQAPPAAGRGGAQAGPPRGGGPPFPRVPSLPFPDAPQVFSALGPNNNTPGQPFRVVPLAKGLVNPWSLAFLPNGDILVTEKPGRLRLVRNGNLEPQPITGTPQVLAAGQGGPAGGGIASLSPAPLSPPDSAAVKRMDKIYFESKGK